MEMTRFKRWAREGRSMAILDICEEFNISRHLAKVCRDLAFLNAEPDLEDIELRIISAGFALAAMGKAGKADDTILPLMTERFKGTLKASGGPMRAREIQANRFTQTMTSVTDSIGFLEDIFVPYIAVDDRKELLNELRSAGSTLRRIRKTIELGGSQDAEAE